MLTTTIAKMRLAVSIMLGASPAKTRTVVIAPGPDKRGMARGTVEMSSLFCASLRAFSVLKCSRPLLSIVIPMPAMNRPPAMRNASMVMLKNDKMKWPTRVNTMSIPPAVSAARLIVASFFFCESPCVKLTNTVAVLKGLTMVKSDASAAKKNARVVPRLIGRNVYVLIYIVCVLLFLQTYL